MCGRWVDRGMLLLVAASLEGGAEATGVFLDRGRRVGRLLYYTIVDYTVLYFTILCLLYG